MWIYSGMQGLFVAIGFGLFDWFIYLTYASLKRKLVPKVEE